MIKKERTQALKKHGTLAEENMPDSIRDIQMQMNAGGK